MNLINTSHKGLGAAFLALKSQTQNSLNLPESTAFKRLHHNLPKGPAEQSPEGAEQPRRMPL